MAAIDAILLLTEILNAAGYTDVNHNRLESRALSSDQYVWLEEATATTLNSVGSGRVDRVTVEMVVYSTRGKRPCRALHMEMHDAIKEAWGKKFTNGGIHHFNTRIAPYRQDIPGLLPETGRTVSQYDFVLADSSKWV